MGLSKWRETQAILQPRGYKDVIAQCIPRRGPVERHRLETVANGAVRRGVSCTPAAHN
jgi:hypothetical protein